MRKVITDILTVDEVADAKSQENLDLPEHASERRPWWNSTLPDRKALRFDKAEIPACSAQCIVPEIWREKLSGELNKRNRDKFTDSLKPFRS